MNQISIFGKTLSKVEFFDFVFDTFVEADYTEPDSMLNLELKILYGILDSYGWTAEYDQWLADGAGTKEAQAELHELLETLNA